MACQAHRRVRQHGLRLYKITNARKTATRVRNGLKSHPVTGIDITALLLQGLHMAVSSTTYPRKWRSGKTTVIRVPEQFAGDLLRIAREIDSSSSYRIREEGDSLVLEMLPARHVSYSAKRPVNVASVPQRSPFRYPGGKTWLIPYIRDWLRAQKSKPLRFVEPFAGGAIVSMTVGFENLAKHVLFSEIDPGVAAVWKVVLNGHAEWLAQQIIQFPISETRAREVLSSRPKDVRQLAFQTILRNRVQRGGIMAPGAGLVKTGENGRGINSRWYPETLARRIREINQSKDRFSFHEVDAFKLIREHQADKDTCFYIDPPYTIAARRLYVAWDVDHEKLFAELAKCKGNFLMSYDNTVEVMRMADKHGFDAKPVAMKNTHHAKMNELLIGRDLSWIQL
jgi:DNA adenine methylase